MLDINTIRQISSKGHHQEAVKEAGKLVKTQPKHIPYLACYAFTLVNAGEFAKAQKIYLQLLKTDPNQIDYLFGSAICYAQVRQFALAEERYLKLIALAPKDFKYKMNYGVLLREHGQFEKSADYLRQAQLDRPDYAEIAHNLGITLEQMEEFDDAITAYDGAIERDQNHFRAMCNQGSVYTKINDLDMAEEKFNASLALSPQYHHALNNLGLTYLYKKQLDQAKAQFFKTIDIHPLDGKGYFNLSNLDNLQDDELHQVITKLETVLAEHKQLPSHDKALFALAQFNEKLKNTEQMKHYLQLGNHYVSSRRGFDHHQTQQSFKLWRQISVNPPEFESPFADQKIIFVIGMPRSGTTLLESILASHDDITAGDELPYLNEKLNAAAKTITSKKQQLTPEDLTAIGAYYIEKSARLYQDGQWLIDKLPHNFKWAALIPTLFPKAKIIHIHRDEMDNCWSLYRVNFEQSHDYCFNMKALGQYFAHYQNLMRDYEAYLGDQMLSVRYEDLVQDPKAQAKRIFSYLECGDFDFDENSRGQGYFSRTASSKQVQAPISTKSLKGWRRHHDFLKPVLIALKKQQSRLGLPEYQDDE